MALLPAILLRHLPGGNRVGLQLAEAGQLLLLRDVQPELDDHRPVIGQLPLKRDDILATLAPGSRVDLLARPTGQNLAIPGAIKYRDLALAGDLEPEAMEPGVLGL